MKDFEIGKQVKIIKCLCPLSISKGNDHAGMTGDIYGKAGNNYMVVSYGIYGGIDTYCYNALEVKSAK